ncbi:MAG TPA: enoyl-CoA hydratase-related protein, partial [Dehalococcoidales bacterium]
MSFETVLYEVKENIARITMNRPEKRNALNHALLRDLDAAFEQAENDAEAKVVILTGSGKAFSAGYDLLGSPYISVPEGYDQWTVGNALKTLRGISARYLRIFNLSKPTIAQIHGYCVAAGCYLQMCCDIAIAAEDAILGHPATRSGGVTSMPLWVTYLGLRKAKELLYTGRLI